MTERELILQCCSEIEQKLQWGPSERWTDQDFEKLGELILEQTKTRLSVSTLKRVWGKVAHNTLPSVSTLDVLASYNGYQSWRNYWQRSSSVANITSATSLYPQPAGQTQRSWWQKPQLRKAIFMICLILLGLLMYFLS